MLAQLLLEWADPVPLVAAAPPVLAVAAVHLTGWWDLRPRRVQRRLLL